MTRMQTLLACAAIAGAMPGMGGFLTPEIYVPARDPLEMPKYLLDPEGFFADQRRHRQRKRALRRMNRKTRYIALRSLR